MSPVGSSVGARQPSRLSVFYTIVLLWLAGAGLRITVLAIPPIIPLLHQDLRLSQTDVGVLSALPLLLFATVAIPGAALIARFGALRILVGGLLLTAVAAALRALAPGVTGLFVATFFMGVGIAVMQPALPPMVRRWLPHRVGFGTAVYANGMLLGETLSVSLTLPVILPLLGQSWRWSLVFWSLPVLLAAVLIAAHARGDDADRAGSARLHRRWWPDWRSPLTWKLGLIMGCASSLFFATNAFLPDFLTRSGRGDLLGAALGILNASQVLATLLLLFQARRLTLRRLPFFVAGLVAVFSVIGLVQVPGMWVLLCCGLIGFCCAFTLTLGLSVPPMVAAADDVPRLAAAIFAISYLCAFVVPIMGGIGWDLTGMAMVAFVPAGVCGGLIIVLSMALDFGSAESG